MRGLITTFAFVIGIIGVGSFSRIGAVIMGLIFLIFLCVGWFSDVNDTLFKDLD
jgi:hypothetical protein